jgi:hypothetical protein
MLKYVSDLLTLLCIVATSSPAKVLCFILLLYDAEKIGWGVGIFSLERNCKKVQQEPFSVSFIKMEKFSVLGEVTDLYWLEQSLVQFSLWHR